MLSIRSGRSDAAQRFPWRGILYEMMTLKIWYHCDSGSTFFFIYISVCRIDRRGALTGVCPPSPVGVSGWRVDSLARSFF